MGKFEIRVSGNEWCVVFVPATGGAVIVDASGKPWSPFEGGVRNWLYWTRSAAIAAAEKFNAGVRKGVQ